MKKDTKNLLLLGAVAVGGYFLLTKTSIAQNLGLTAPRSSANTPIEVTSVTPDGTEVTETVNTTEEGVNAINRAVTSGRTLKKSFSFEAIPKDFGVTVKGDTRGTVFRTGTGGIFTNISDGKQMFVGIRQPLRDAQGLSNFDRLIIKNKSLSSNLGYTPTAEEARRLGFI